MVHDVDTFMHHDARCPSCGGPLIQKDRTRLLLAAFAYLVVAVGPVVWLPGVRIAIVLAIVCGLIAAYLFVWARAKVAGAGTARSFPLG